MTDIFISYSRKDNELVLSLATALEKLGYSVWWDVSGLHGGQAFASEIQKAIKQAKCVIVVWSEASVTSGWVHSEATQADSQGNLLTAVYQDAHIPLPFNNRHNESLRNWEGDPDDPDFQKLLQAIARYGTEHSVTSDQQKTDTSTAPGAMPLLPKTAVDSVGETVVLGAAMPWRAGVAAALLCTVGAYLILPVWLGDAAVPEKPQPAATQTPSEGALNTPVPTPTPAAEPSYSLTVEVEPKAADVTIKLPDIVPKYRAGMLLKPGTYRVQVSAPGYKSEQTTAVLTKKNRVILVKLKPERLEFEPKMVDISAGSFWMGCADGGRDHAHGVCDKNETPGHRVNVPDFMMAETEITVGQFRAFTEATNYKTTAETEGSCWLNKMKKSPSWPSVNPYSWRNPGFSQTDDHPVVCVTRQDVMKYLEWLNGVTGRVYRLPSEAEWEYAARGGNATNAYPWGQHGKDGCGHANMADQTAKKYYGYLEGAAGCHDKYVHTAPVGRFAANGFELHDMHGNVAEWVEDVSHADYNSAPEDGSAWVETSSPDPLRMVRGGSWHSTPWYARSAFRGRGVDKTHRYVTLGFRLVRNK